MKITKFIPISLIVSFGIDATLIILLRPIRSLFPLPEIGSGKIIGYSQYFGYPLSFDTVFFFVLILVPLLIVFFTYLFKRNK
jgi:hypothetical protein